MTKLSYVFDKVFEKELKGSYEMLSEQSTTTSSSTETSTSTSSLVSDIQIFIDNLNKGMWKDEYSAHACAANGNRAEARFYDGMVVKANDVSIQLYKILKEMKNGA
jgi:hypothetical protein